MSRDKLWEGRTQGMILALGIVKKDGIEALEEEIRFRGHTGVSLMSTKAEINKAMKPLKDNIIKNVFTLMLMVLRDEFGFGKNRLQRALHRAYTKVDAMDDDLYDMQDYREVLEKETGIKIVFED